MEKQLGKRGMSQTDRAQDLGLWPSCCLYAGTWWAAGEFASKKSSQGTITSVSQQEAGTWRLVGGRPTKASSSIQRSRGRSSHSHRPGSKKDTKSWKLSGPKEVIYAGSQAEKNQRGTQKWAKLRLGRENRAEAQSLYLRQNQEGLVFVKCFLCGKYFWEAVSYPLPMCYPHICWFNLRLTDEVNFTGDYGQIFIFLGHNIIIS